MVINYTHKKSTRDFILVYSREHKTVVPLAPDSLNSGGAQPLFGCDHIQHPADTLHVCVRAIRLDDCAFADNVIDNNYCSRAGEFQCQPEVTRITGLIGIDENEIERSHSGRNELRK